MPVFQVLTNFANFQSSSDSQSEKPCESPIDSGSAIPGRHLSSLISMAYIFGFRKDNTIFFNGLGQNHPAWVSLKRLCH